MSNFFVITKEKEGFEVPENEIPIDINYQKLLDWLVDRKRIPNDWNVELQKLEKEVIFAKNLISNDEKFKPFISGELWFSKVEEIVKEIEKNEKGWTGSKEGNAWRRVLKHLKWKYLFLAHSARILLSLVNYEISALKKESDMYQKQISDSEKKIADFAKSSQELRNQFDRECKKMGIQGENIIDELNELTSELPEFYKQIAKLAQSDLVQQCIHFYKQFTENMHRSLEDEEVNSNIESIISNICPTLSYVYKYGDDYLEIMERRNRGEEITANDYLIYDEIKKKSNQHVDDLIVQPTINWDIDEAINDFGDNIDGSEVHDIKWDITDDTNNDGATIDWDISVEDSGDTQASIQWDIETADDSTNHSNDHPLQGNESSDIEHSLETILGSTITRNRFKNDLLELQAFLKQRIVEMENDKGVLLSQVVSQKADDLSISSVKQFLSHIDSILDSFNHERFRLLIDIKTSKRYTERLAGSLKQKMDLSQRATSAETQYQKKLQILEENLTSVHPKIKVLVEDARAIKKHIESELSKLYSNRPVRLTGEISKVLA